MLDLKFLHAPAGEAPLLAVLYQDLKSARHIKTYRVSLKDKVRCALKRQLGRCPWKRQLGSACAQPSSRACMLRQEQHPLGAWKARTAPGQHPPEPAFLSTKAKSMQDVDMFACCMVPS